MYKKILLPVDDSALSIAAALKGVALAQSLSAQVLAFEVLAPYQLPVYLDPVPDSYPSPDEYEARSRSRAYQRLKIIADAAARASLHCDQLVDFDSNVAQTIVNTAAGEHCDLIFMGSHGRSGLSRIFLGSIATRVLTLSQIPVLVHRTTEQDAQAVEKSLKVINATA
jgi:nucleotide-binding universal stress UspA family protein